MPSSLLQESGGGLLTEQGRGLALEYEPPAEIVLRGGIARVSDITQKCYDGGQNWESSWHKVPALSSSQMNWCDLSSAPGTPKPNYYVGAELTATTLNGTTGLYHGGNVAPATKHLHKFTVGSFSSNVTPATFILLDYLLFYPLIDMDSTDEQALVNTISLPRYTDGYGVQAFLVATNPYIGGAGFYITYTNDKGESGRRSVVEVSNTATYIGTILHSGTAATSGRHFIRLAPGDTGIRSVQSITFIAPNGGLAALVLAKPLATLFTQDVTAYAEFDFLTMKPFLPRIYDGAYLNLLVCPNNSYASMRINGTMSVIWN